MLLLQLGSPSETWLWPPSQCLLTIPKRLPGRYLEKLPLEGGASWLGAARPGCGLYLADCLACPHADMKERT